MNLEVCRDIALIVTRRRCNDPGCGCNPQEVAMGILAHIKADPVDGFNLLMAAFNMAVSQRKIMHGSFENGLMIGIALAAASDNVDLVESLKAAQQVNPNIRDNLAKMKPQ